MVLGDKSLLDADLKASYAKAGVSHVLAVSGLHVGIIFVVFNFLFSIFFKGNLLGPRLLRALLTVCCLWGYAFLTGLSPSVMRASVMFSFLQFGFLFQRPYSVYSSVVASAFVLLLYNPSFLFDVGFQLSYMAILSILFFYPRLSSLSLITRLKNCSFRFLPSRVRTVPQFLTSWSVDLTIVSLAAQIGTAPLVLYYFHQFSCVFWLSGLFVLPLAVALVYLALMSFVVSPFPSVASLFVGLLSFVASVTNAVVCFFSSFPFSVIDFIDFRFEDLLCSYVALTFISFYLYNRRFLPLFCGLLVFCISGTLSVFRRHSVPDVSVAVYNYSGRSAVNVFGSGFNRLYSTADSSMVCRQLKSFWIRQHTVPAQLSSSHLLVGGRASAFIVDKDLSGCCAEGAPIAVDLLVISSDVRVPIGKLKAIFNYKHLVIDSSCSLATSYWWKKQCPEAYLVRQRGDFIEHL